MSTKKNNINIYIILDESESMKWNIGRDTVIEVINNIISEQKTLLKNVIYHKCIFTLITFGTDEKMPRIKTIFDRIDINNIPLFTREHYNPKGNTPLYDAIGTTILKLTRENKIENTLFIIETNGNENASQKITKNFLKKIINDAKTKGVKFKFLSTTNDSILDPKTIGFTETECEHFTSNKDSFSRINNDISSEISGQISRCISGKIDNKNIWSYNNDKCEDIHPNIGLKSNNYITKEKKSCFSCLLI